MSPLGVRELVGGPLQGSLGITHHYSSVGISAESCWPPRVVEERGVAGVIPWPMRD